MFEFLQQLDKGIYDRYLTLEKNIKAASNSFYDAYLALQEHFVKLVAEKNGIEIGAHETCGAMLKRIDIKALFLDKYGLDDHTYDKMNDYTKKANEHKHKKEKNIEGDTVVNYVRVFYDISSSVAKSIWLNVPPFDGTYFKNLFGKMEKTDERLEVIEDGQQSIMQSLERLQKQIEFSGASGQAAQQNSVVPTYNSNLVLKNFIAKAEKQYNWMGPTDEFSKCKLAHILVQLAMILVGGISSILSTICLNIYSTFTFFENIVVFGTFFLLCYTLKAKKVYPDYKLAKQNSDIFAKDKDGIWRNTGKEKKRYKVFRRIGYVCVGLNIAAIWVLGSNLVLQIFATIFEAAFLGLTVAAVFTRVNLYCLYTTVFISGYNASHTEKVTIVHDGITHKLYLYEDYIRDFPFVI